MGEYAEERDNNLYAKINESEWLLFSNEREIKLDDWVIRGHQYFSDNETIRIDIREFYIDLTGTPVTPPTFLSITFKKYINEWKIVSFGFDV